VPYCRRHALLSSLPATSVVLAIRDVRCGSGAAPFSLCNYARRAAAPILILRRASLQAPVCYCLLCQRRSRYTRRALRFWLCAFLAVREARCGPGSDSAPCLLAGAVRCCLRYQLPAPFSLYAACAAVLALHLSRCTRGALRLRLWFCAVPHCRRRALLSPVPAPFSLYATCAVVLALLRLSLAVREARCGYDPDSAPCLMVGAVSYRLLNQRRSHYIYATCAAALALHLSRCTRGALRLRF
jgi:hypothetical protein